MGPVGLVRAESPTLKTAAEELMVEPRAESPTIKTTAREAMDELQTEAGVNPMGTVRAESPTEITPPPVPEPPVFVSMKPPSEPGTRERTPMVAAIERPEMQPRLRPLSEPSSAPPARASGSLGRYAPPRERALTPRDRGSLLLYVVLIAAAALLGAVVAWWLRSAG